MRFFSSVALIAILAGPALSAELSVRVLPEPAINGKPDIRPAQPPGETLSGSGAESQATDKVTRAGRKAIVISEALLQRPPARNDATLDDLFVRLGEAEGAAEARGVVLMINRRWLRSGSDTADLLMTRARQAMRERDDALAVELLDRIIAMQPDWAEAWNRRAVAFHRLGDPLAAMADIHRTVTLEPRHFSAWAGLGHILREIGDEAAALASYEQALSLYPTMPRLEPIVETLRRDLYGLDL
ncbi:tetratricopeptide repeat protein [Saliniramus sp.]|uniref:tetratricopeptide repeat protein n=1 Tax=Saliniramus sp. TaxID=2986772 RepID=UPI002BF92302|nr:hypothetical protein [Saliniramus sp.]HMB11983.1 hypothetical protein [Saliniramus sp.]